MSGGEGGKRGIAKNISHTSVTDGKQIWPLHRTKRIELNTK